MRRLPIYFLIDISESMVGEPIQQVEEGLAMIIKELKTDPHSIETVWVSIVVFAGQPKTIVPLQEIINFYPPRFPIGSGTSLSKGLGHLMYELRKNQVKTTYEQKGDWKPIVFLFTDGVPTDDTAVAIDEWKKNWQRTANMVAVSFGEEADMHLLSQMTENVLHFKNSDAAAYKSFFKWVTDSIKTSSVSVENNTGGFDLAKLDGDTLAPADLKNPAPGSGSNSPVNYAGFDSNFVVLSGKCQNSKRPYLMKYKKTLKDSGIYAGLETMSYRLVGAYQVDNSYYELTDNNENGLKINTSELMGSPTCPCCGNQYAFAMCGCGKIHCIGDEEESTCPWCGSKGKYTSGGSGGFDVTRAQG
jgi:uncharacterized protein YegL